ncbi:hypothetical protein HK102_012905 [Quaeritorhiza haematococci]|nr:hypothetical protein HK102_012905 [Quaeritorhiza haematococci]
MHGFLYENAKKLVEEYEGRNIRQIESEKVELSGELEAYRQEIIGIEQQIVELRQRVEQYTKLCESKSARLRGLETQLKEQKSNPLYLDLVGLLRRYEEGSRGETPGNGGAIRQGDNTNHSINTSTAIKTEDRDEPMPNIRSDINNTSSGGTGGANNNTNNRSNANSSDIQRTNVSRSTDTGSIGRSRTVNKNDPTFNPHTASTASRHPNNVGLEPVVAYQGASTTRQLNTTNAGRSRSACPDELDIPLSPAKTPRPGSISSITINGLVIPFGEAPRIAGPPTSAPTVSAPAVSRTSSAVSVDSPPSKRRRTLPSRGNSHDSSSNSSGRSLRSSSEVVFSQGGTQQDSRRRMLSTDSCTDRVDVEVSDVDDETEAGGGFGGSRNQLGASEDDEGYVIDVDEENGAGINTFGNYLGAFGEEVDLEAPQVDITDHRWYQLLGQHEFLVAGTWVREDTLDGKDIHLYWKRIRGTLCKVCLQGKGKGAVNPDLITILSKCEDQMTSTECRIYLTDRLGIPV